MALQLLLNDAEADLVIDMLKSLRVVSGMQRLMLDAQKTDKDPCTDLEKVLDAQSQMITSLEFKLRCNRALA